MNNAKKQREKIDWERLDRDLLNKIGDTKGIFHAKISTILGRNGKDQTKTEEIKGSKNTQKNYTLKKP